MSEDPSATRNLSILHVTAPGPVGGLESVVRATTTDLHGRGHRIGVIAVVEPGQPDHPFVESLRREGVEVTQLNLHARAYVREIRRVHTEIRRFAPDVLHTHGSRADLLHFPTARALGIPIATTLHGSSMRGGLAGLSERFQGILLKRFDAVVAVSSPLARELTERGVSPDRVHLIPNAPGTMATSFPRSVAHDRLGLGESDTPVIGWVGRLIPVKGGDIFLRALAALPDERWTASMIGDGPERGPLESLANELGIENRVQFHGAVPDAAKYQSAFDLFVLSSYSEGIPMVVFEAAAARTPIVASAVGGIPDVLSDREAHLVPAGDVDALAGAIRASLGDSDGAHKRAIRARERIEREFSGEVWMDRYEKLYRALVPTGR